MAIKIILADSAGVCFGVENAVSTAEKELLKNKKVWIGAAVVVIIFAWVLWSGQPAPEVTQ